MLVCSNINVYHGKMHVIKNVSFKINEKEMVTIIGANGAGKTTLVNTVSGLKQISSGEISFFDERIQNKESHKIVPLGITQVPEGRQIFTEMSVMENLEMGSYRPRARLHRKETIEYVFSLFPELGKRKKQSGGSLSGGQQQMLSIARGLMSKPKLLILDEPSLGLAPLLVEKIYETILNLKKDGTTILLIEQNVFKALRYADRGYVLEEGKITLEGTGVELLQNEHIKKAYLGI